jgi:hypothetical protein
MLTVIVARERPDGNLKTMVLLLDLWKKGIRDCFVDANLSKAALRHLCMKLGQSYHLAEQPPIDMSQEQVKSNGGGGRIHQFLWQRSRAVSKREKGTWR